MGNWASEDHRELLFDATLQLAKDLKDGLAHQAGKFWITARFSHSHFPFHVFSAAVLRDYSKNQIFSCLLAIEKQLQYNVTFQFGH